MAFAFSCQFECRSIWLVVENSSEWRSLDSEIPSFKLQEKISRRRFEKLSKNCQNFWSAKLLSSQVFVVSLYNKDRDWHFWSARKIFGQKVEYAGSLGVNSCLRILPYLFHSVYRNVPISGAFSIYVTQVACRENGPDEMTNMSCSLVLQLSSLLSEPHHGGNTLVYKLVVIICW